MKCEVCGKKPPEWQVRQINNMPMITCVDFDNCDQGQPLSDDPPEVSPETAVETQDPPEVSPEPAVETQGEEDTPEPPPVSERAPARSRSRSRG